MIIACFRKKHDNFTGFNIEGHSGYAESGSDIICSAVSSVSIAIANGITDVLNIKADIGMDDGFLSLSIKNNSAEDIEKCQVLFKTMFLSFDNIRKEYKDYIEVIIAEEV